MLSDGSAVYSDGSERRGSASSFRHTDALGSTRGITNSSQSATDSLLLDAFGMTVSRTGSTPTPFGFVGSEQYQSDPDSGLMLLGHRYYDPSIGRFITSDPAQDGTNWYAYCGNDPLGGVDPEGTDPNDKKKKGDPPYGKWFPTPDAAAVAVLDYIYPGSEREGKEKGGYIVFVPRPVVPPGLQTCVNGPGYTPEPPVSVGDDHSLPPDFGDVIPKMAVGWYHTHPKVAGDYGDRKYDDPSTGDSEIGHDSKHGGAHPLITYIGSPKYDWRVDVWVNWWGLIQTKKRIIGDRP